MVGLWAKLDRGDSDRWLSLVAHSCDVAAVMQAMLETWHVRRTLEALAGRDLTPTDCSRLAALAYLHDVGKANKGFQARVDPSAPPVGHIRELRWIFGGCRDQDLIRRISAAISLDELDVWLDGNNDLFDAIFAHHGRPWRRPERDCHRYWEGTGPDSPVAAIATVCAPMRGLFPAAYSLDAAPLPVGAKFAHAFAGYLMFADWLGSDTTHFPLSDGGDDDTRFASSLHTARQVLKSIGFDATDHRSWSDVSFEAAFGHDRPSEIQTTAAEVEGRLVIVESETGSGKTEGALWRFLMLFSQGEVDGLYFALPTRAAAAQMFYRVRNMRDRLFPDGSGPSVLMAVPGQFVVDNVRGTALPDFEVQWDDGDNDDRRWAASHPKRYMAASIVVGTIDQVLAGSLQVRHAHMRSSLLTKSLLVIDEVHASDSYMQVLLNAAVDTHLDAGGHAMCLSATLGATLRSRLLKIPVPSFQDAAKTAYPLISALAKEQASFLAVPSAASKAAKVSTIHGLSNESDVARAAISAAAAGAKVLVIKNTVSAAIRILKAIERAPDAQGLLWKVDDVVTLHHSRFSSGDRRALDAGVETALGKSRSPGGVIVVGTQTLEQSLDIDADLLISDICPIDVLLQRFGRLHRHGGRCRPAGFEEPIALVVVPTHGELAAAAVKPRFGLGCGPDGGVYEDLRAIVGTMNSITEHPVWTIPSMSRMLVEGVLHPDRLGQVLPPVDHVTWAKHVAIVEGVTRAETIVAKLGVIDRSAPIDDLQIGEDMTFGTRLGLRDRSVTFDVPAPSPFGRLINGLNIPDHLAKFGDERIARIQSASASGIAFHVGAQRYWYDRYGLQQADG